MTGQGRGAEALVCDVDNTILDTRPRVRRCLEAIGRGEVYARGAHRYGGFKEFLTAPEIDRFFEVFLSDRHLGLDAPLPGAAETLRAWQRSRGGLIYLTGRHDAPGDSMREGTLRWLKDHGYPRPNGQGVRLVMKPRRFLNDLEHKRAALDHLRGEFDLKVGLGDLPQEGPLYAEFGLAPILIRQVGMFQEEELRAHPEVVVVPDWAGVARVLRLSPG